MNYLGGVAELNFLWVLLGGVLGVWVVKLVFMHAMTSSKKFLGGR